MEITSSKKVNLENSCLWTTANELLVNEFLASNCVMQENPPCAISCHGAEDSVHREDEGTSP